MVGRAAMTIVDEKKGQEEEGCLRRQRGGQRMVVNGCTVAIEAMRRGTSRMRSSEWLTWTKIIDLNISFLWGLLEVGNNQWEKVVAQITSLFQNRLLACKILLIICNFNQHLIAFILNMIRSPSREVINFGLVQFIS